MRLRVLLPTEVLVDRQGVLRVAAEAGDGAFVVEPRHVDTVFDLVPGILSYTTESGESLLAIDRGTLVKCDSTVTVSAQEAIAGDSLEKLERTVDEHLLARDERERRAISAVARLEASLVRRFLDVDWSGHG
jgi:F-type H+-transporting ATPase subunit epsilon